MLESFGSKLLADISSYCDLKAVLSLACVCHALHDVVHEDRPVWIARLDTEETALRDLSIEQLKEYVFRIEGVVVCDECDCHQFNRKGVDAAREAFRQYVEDARQLRLEEIAVAQADPDARPLRRMQLKCEVEAVERGDVIPYVHDDADWDPSMLKYKRQHFGDVEEFGLQFSKTTVCQQCGEYLSIPELAYDRDRFFSTETAARDTPDHSSRGVAQRGGRKPNRGKHQRHSRQAERPNGSRGVNRASGSGGKRGRALRFVD